MDHLPETNKSEYCLCKRGRHYFLNTIILACIIILLSVSFESFEITDNRPLPRPRYEKRETCSDILEIKEPTTSISDEVLVSAMEDIAVSKRTLKYLRYVAYFALSTFVPSLVTEESQFDVTSNTITKESRLDQMNWKIPYLPCQLRKYTDDDVHKCIERRRQKNKTFRITFMGDSRIRRLMESTLELLHKFNFTTLVIKMWSLNNDKILYGKKKMWLNKNKEDLIIKSKHLPTFEFKLFWAPYISRGDDGSDSPKYMNYLYQEKFSSASSSKEKKPSLNINKRSNKREQTNKLKKQVDMKFTGGIKDELHRLVKKPQEDLPDLIIIDSGLWLLRDTDDDILFNIEKRAIEGIRKIFNDLQKLATKMTVILLLPHPIKEFLKDLMGSEFECFSLLNTKNLQWHLNAQIQLLPKNVLIWDSFIPITYASASDCFNILSQKVNISSLPKIPRFDKGSAYGCRDKNHVGFEALGIASQMMINHICNFDMVKDIGNSYCCES